jgi:hypothetical protein
MINHSIIFIYNTTAATNNTTESTWRHLNASLSPYNIKTNYILYLAKHVPKEMQGRKCSPIVKIHTNYEKQTGAHQSRMKNMKNRTGKLSTYCDKREVIKV